MKEIIEVIESRLKAPTYGYFAFAFVAINWKPLFYLFVEEKDAITRISYFDSNTSFYSLVLYPVAFAAVFSVVYPWINCIMLYLYTKPNEVKNVLQAHSEHKLLLKKQELEKVRAAILSNAEMELIDRAKRDEELNKIENIEIKEQVKSKIEQLRKEKGNSESDNLYSEFKNPNRLLEIASSYRQRAESASTMKDKESLIERARELETKAHNIIMDPDVMLHKDIAF